MTINKSIRYPAVQQIKIGDVPRQPEHELIEKWGWSDLQEVWRCLNAQNLGMKFNLGEIITNFAPLNGHVDYQPVVTYVTTGCSGNTEPNYSINQPVGEFVFNDRFFYSIPSTWAKRILTLKEKYSARLAVDSSPLYAIGTILTNISTGYYTLWALAVGGASWELPSKLCPDLSKLLDGAEAD